MAKSNGYAALVKQGVMSAELAAMLTKSEQIRKARRYVGITRRMVICEKIANRILRKAGFFPAKVQAEPMVLPAEACVTGGLRATWHGRP